MPCVFFKMLTASSWVNPSRDWPLTERIWSPLDRVPSSAAAPLLNTVFTQIGRSPCGLPWPPTMENPSPSGPRFRVIVLNWGGWLCGRQNKHRVLVKNRTFNDHKLATFYVFTNVNSLKSHLFENPSFIRITPYKRWILKLLRERHCCKIRKIYYKILIFCNTGTLTLDQT